MIYFYFFKSDLLMNIKKLIDAYVIHTIFFLIFILTILKF